ncbi:MAG: acyl-phosphate glycerol 3-phosphate acyltransferase [Desulfuromonas sp.]|nr:MAG: acyl-phosphate glycerol 3-phosphate acyltransferase [Desulfuromonas sp.]
MTNLHFVLLLCAAYLVGAIPTGVVLTRLIGADDVRKSGSGNIGATNVYRVAGRAVGVATLLCDILKGVLPVIVATKLNGSPTQIASIAIIAFLGHCYPVYLGFRGGKGVATALGIFMVLSPQGVVLAAALFVLLVWKFRYISFGSVSAAASIPFLVYAFERQLPLTLASLLIAGMVIWRHRSNIQRLINGTENRFKL